MKVQDAGALIGGVIKMIIIFQIVSYLPNEILREKIILNELLHASTQSKEDINKSNGIITHN